MRVVVPLAAVCCLLGAEETAEVLKLQEALKRLETRIEVLESAKGGEATSRNKGTLELRSFDTVLTVGGRIQLDTVWGWPESTHFAGKIALNDGADAQLDFSARDSRLWVKTRTPSQYGMVRALIETDFWGSNGSETVANSHGLRLRHAYVQVGPWTAGQTNSVFNAAVTMDTLYDALDYTLVRQPLLRYEAQNEGWSWALSLEEPETTLYNAAGTLLTPNDDRLPDIGGRLRLFASRGEAGAAVMLRRLYHDGAVAGTSDSALGWGINTYAMVRLGGDGELYGGLAGGEGIGRYLAYNAFPAGSVDAEGDIRVQPSWGAHLGYRHWWRDDLRSTAAVSGVRTDNGIAVGTLTRQSGSLQLNLIWTPLKDLLTGVEYAHARRETEAGDGLDADLLRFCLRYEF